MQPIYHGNLLFLMKAWAGWIVVELCTISSINGKYSLKVYHMITQNILTSPAGG